MGRIIVNSKYLDAVANELETNCFMLGYVNDVDDLDDVDCYAQRIQRAIDELRIIIKKSEPAEPDKK